MPSTHELHAFRPAPTSPGLPLALEGFSAFERQTLESYLRLCARETLFEAGASLADCAFCVVDADRPAAVEAVRAARRQSASIYVGGKAPDGAAAHLPRPIDPRRVAHALDTLARAMRARVAFADPNPQERTTAALTPASGSATATATAPAITLPAHSLPAEPARRSARPGAATTSAFELDVLVVDDLDITRRLLVAQLERLGCRVAEAVDAQEALARLAEQRFRLVFADVALCGLDGLALCQRIKQAGAGAPAVVLVGAPASPSDRVRRLLSGCDGQLAKPIASADLITVLSAHGNRRRRARSD